MVRVRQSLACQQNMGITGVLIKTENDHARYIPFVVITIWFFLHSWLITEVCNKSNTSAAKSGVGNTYSFGTPDFTPIY